MDARAGFTTPNMLEAETDRALVDAARRLVVVADHTKWGVIGVSTIARLSQADLLISDAGLSEEARAILGEQVQELIIAGEPHRGGTLVAWRGETVVDDSL
jgi:DeoR/GlpR family transcriptional regulator of sugar metabolism